MKKLIRSSTEVNASSKYEEHTTYNRGGQRFSIYQSRTDNPNLWEAQISEIHPYDDAPYHFAEIQPNKRAVFYSARGNEVSRLQLSHYDEDDYESVEEYYDDMLDYVCAELRNLNREIEPKIIHNSVDASSRCRPTSVLSSASTGVQKIHDKVRNAARAVMKSPSFGFPEDEIDDYLHIDVSKDASGIRVEVRAELSYSGMRDLAVWLDPIVQEYDPDAYFDDVDPGIMEAYIRNLSGIKDIPPEHIASAVEAANYGGAYDIDPEMYFTKDELVEFGNQIVDEFNECVPEVYDLSAVYMDTPNTLTMSVSDGDFEFTHTAAIDMRRIQKPSDIEKYRYKFIQSFLNQHKELVLSDDVTSATNTSGIAAGAWDVPEPPLDPPDYPDPIELDDTTEEIELSVDTVIILDEDGSWDYEDDKYSFAADPQDSRGEWRSYEYYHVTFGDPGTITEYLDELIASYLPEGSGRYRITYDATLMFELSNILKWPARDPYDEGEVIQEDIDVKFLPELSTISNFTCNPV